MVNLDKIDKNLLFWLLQELVSRYDTTEDYDYSIEYMCGDYGLSQVKLRLLLESIVKTDINCSLLDLKDVEGINNYVLKFYGKVHDEKCYYSGIDCGKICLTDQEEAYRLFKEEAKAAKKLCEFMVHNCYNEKYINSKMKIVKLVKKQK